MLNDIKLETMLVMLRTRFPNIYRSIKKTVEKIVKKIALRETEDAFLEWNTNTHCFYHVAPHVQKDFAHHMGARLKDFTNAFFVVPVGQTLGVLYLLNEYNYIKSFQ